MLLVSLVFALLHSAFLLVPDGRREDLLLLSSRMNQKMSEEAHSINRSVHLVVRLTNVSTKEEGNSRDRSTLLVHNHSGSAFLAKYSAVESDDRGLAIQALREVIGVESFAEECFQRMFAFCSSDAEDAIAGTNVVYEYHAQEEDILSTLEESASFQLVPTTEVHEPVNAQEGLALRLYLQRHQDLRVDRRLLHGYSGSDLDNYCLRPKPSAIFFDCDDCLYFDSEFCYDKYCLPHPLPPRLDCS